MTTTTTTATPARETWPAAPAQTEAGGLVTQTALQVMRLHGRLMEAAERMAAAGELTSTQWRVVGGVIDEPRSVADVARLMGMTRQGVQRVADQLADRGLVEYRPNPAHRRAKLVACTEAGYWAIRRIALVQQPWADEVGAATGAEALRDLVAGAERLVEVLEAGAESA